MTSTANVLEFENPIFRAYLTHAAVLVLKMMLMAILTGRQRLTHKVVPSSEDIKFLKTLISSSGKPITRHEDVERVRRAHRNDLENIPIFFMVAFAYLFTDPCPVLALNLFRIFTISRCAHTFVYAIYVIPQPARGLAWIGAYVVTGYMAIAIILHFCTF